MYIYIYKSIYNKWVIHILRAVMGACGSWPPAGPPPQRIRECGQLSNPRCLPMGVEGWTWSAEGR